MCCVPNFVREENNFVCIVEAREHTEMLAEYQQIQQASDTQCVIVNKLDGNRGPHKATRFWKSHINRSPLLCTTRRAGRANDSYGTRQTQLPLRSSATASRNICARPPRPNDSFGVAWKCTSFSRPIAPWEPCVFRAYPTGLDWKINLTSR